MTPQSSPVPTYGDPDWRGKCPKEAVEQISFVNKIRMDYPDTWGRLLVHIRNEDGRASARQVNRMKLEGLTTGAADLIIPGRISFVCEMKRKDRTQSRLSDYQAKYLEAAQNAGAFVAVCFGAVAALEAFDEWRMMQ